MKSKLMIYCYCCVAAMAGLSACSTDEIDPWTDKGFAWFTSENVDFSFRAHPEIAKDGSYLVPIPVTVASNVADRDRALEVEVVAEPKDSRTKYEIVRPVRFRAGHIVDTMFVKVYNSDHLYSVHDTISFKMLPSADFKVGLADNAVTNLCLYNGLPRPDWWKANDFSSNWMLGKFTQLKMEIYLKVTGGMEDPTLGNGWWNNNAVIMIVYKLNEYVRMNNIHYPADDPYAPGQQPYFGSNSY